MIVGGKRFPLTGAYRNDCPYCKTHNAILMYHPAYQCRDCKRWFKLIEDGNAFAWEEYVDEEPHDVDDRGAAYARMRRGF